MLLLQIHLKVSAIPLAHSATFTVADTEGPTLSSSNPTDEPESINIDHLMKAC